MSAVVALEQREQLRGGRAVRASVVGCGGVGEPVAHDGAPEQLDLGEVPEEIGRRSSPARGDALRPVGRAQAPANRDDSADGVEVFGVGEHEGERSAVAPDDSAGRAAVGHSTVRRVLSKEPCDAGGSERRM